MIDLTIPFEGLRPDRLLNDWRWLVPKNYTPLHLTKFGDWFFADTSGHVFHLDLLEGTLSQVASSISEYNTLKNQPDKHSEWFLDGFVFRCDREGLHLQTGQCYGWRIHPMIGGRFEFENIQIFPISVYQSLMGQLLRRWAQLKPGDPIPQITIKAPWWKLWGRLTSHRSEPTRRIE